MAASAEQGEHEPRNLAKARAKNVAQILEERIRFTVPTVNPPTMDHVYATGALGKEDVKRVEIDFLPACPHECPCETGDPLYKLSPQR